MVTAQDAPVLWAAQAAGCQLLVTGDRTHFGPLFGSTQSGLRVLPPAAAALWLAGGTV